MSLFSQAKNTAIINDSINIRNQIQYGDEKEIDRIGYWDSIQNNINGLYVSVQKSNLLLDVAAQYEYIGVYNKAILAQKLSIKNYLSFKKIESIAPVLKKIGTNYLSLSNYSLAQEYYEKALKLFTYYKDSANVAACLANIGTTYYYRSVYSKAIEYKLNALKQYEFLNDTNAIAIMFIDISTNYQELNNLSQAKVYCEKGLLYFKQSKNTKGILRSQRRLATIYRDLKRYDSSLYNFNEAIKINTTINEHYDLASNYMGIASVYGDLKQHETSIFNYKKALSLLIEQDDKTNIAMCLFNLGSNYFELKKYNEAKIQLTKSIKVAETTSNLSVLMMGHELLSELHEKLNNTNESYSHYKKFISLKDSIFNEENIKKTVQAEENYKYEKKEFASQLEQEKKINAIELNNERKNNTKNIVLIITIALLLIGGAIGYIVYRNNKQKQALREFEKNELKQKLLVSQMNPHFIFNSVDHIQSLIGKRDDEAKMYLHRFAKLTRQILEYSRETHISVADEIEVIENYISIQQLLFDNKFSYELDIDDSIETEAFLIPPMLTQPFIENAIKHGLKGKASGGKIWLKFYIKEQQLYFEIIDNGTGFISEKTSEHKSLAMKITKERLGDLAEKIITENRYNERNEIVGAKIVFEIPYIYEK